MENRAHALVAGLFLAMAMLDYARGRVMAIVAARYQDRLDRRVFAAAMKRAALVQRAPEGEAGGWVRLSARMLLDD